MLVRFLVFAMKSQLRELTCGQFFFWHYIFLICNVCVCVAITYDYVSHIDRNWRKKESEIESGHRMMAGWLAGSSSSSSLFISILVMDQTIDNNEWRFENVCCLFVRCLNENWNQKKNFLLGTKWRMEKNECKMYLQ